MNGWEHKSGTAGATVSFVVAGAGSGTLIGRLETNKLGLSCILGAHGPVTHNSNARKHSTKSKSNRKNMVSGGQAQAIHSPAGIRHKQGGLGRMVALNGRLLVAIIGVGQAVKGRERIGECRLSINLSHRDDQP